MESEWTHRHGNPFLSDNITQACFVTSYPSECLCVQLLLLWLHTMTQVLLCQMACASLPAAIVLLWQYQIPAVLWETIFIWQTSFIVWICPNPISHPTKNLTWGRPAYVEVWKLCLKGWKFLPCEHTVHNEPFYSCDWLLKRDLALSLLLLLRRLPCVGKSFDFIRRFPGSVYHQCSLSI